MAKGRVEMFPPDVLARYDALIARVPDVKRKGATMPYTSLNGNMFSFLLSDGTLCLRLPTAPREEVLATYRTKLHEAHGTVMAEYVEIPPELDADRDTLATLFQASHAYVSSLKAKPTTRRKASSP